MSTELRLKDISYGHCHCGCGHKTNISGQNSTKHSYVKGEPLRYIFGHGSRQFRKASRIVMVEGREFRTIPLTQGLEALVNKSDYKWLRHHTWFAHKERRTFYAWRWSKKRKAIKMHREIMGVTGKRKVDHKNGNGLDNRRCNIRQATNRQNSSGMRKRKGKSSRFKGVRWFSRLKMWQAYIWNGKKSLQKHLGYFTVEQEAARAYDKAARVSYGEFAALNFPRKEERSCIKEYTWPL
jgi:hypothetical protein